MGHPVVCGALPSFLPDSLTPADAAGEHEFCALVVRSQDVLDEDAALVVHQGAAGGDCNRKQGVLHWRSLSTCHSFQDLNMYRGARLIVPRFCKPKLEQIGSLLLSGAEFWVGVWLRGAQMERGNTRNKKREISRTSLITHISTLLSMF